MITSDDVTFTNSNYRVFNKCPTGHAMRVVEGRANMDRYQPYIRGTRSTRVGTAFMTSNTVPQSSPEYMTSVGQRVEVEVRLDRVRPIEAASNVSSRQRFSVL